MGQRPKVVESEPVGLQSGCHLGIAKTAGHGDLRTIWCDLDEWRQVERRHQVAAAVGDQVERVGGAQGTYALRTGDDLLQLLDRLRSVDPGRAEGDVATPVRQAGHGPILSGCGTAGLQGWCGDRAMELRRCCVGCDRLRAVRTDGRE